MELAGRVEPERLRDLTMRMVRVPSWPGDERAMADCYSQILERAGLAVEWDRACPESPSVIGRWRGASEGPTLQLDGHTDTVPVDHSPPYEEGGVLYGRGTADMKSRLAASAEVCRILIASGIPLRGQLLVTAHGQHEKPAPGRRLHEPLLALFERGVKGDACIIPEGPEHELVITGKGLMIWEAVFRRDGEPVHEVWGGANIPNPVMGAHRFISLLQERAERWTLVDPLVGGESFFVGAFQGGALYNVIPTTCRLEGVRRYPVGRSFDAAAQEFREVAAQVASETKLMVDLHLMKSGQPYRLSETAPVVRAVRWGYEAVTGKAMPVAGMRLSADAAQFNNQGGIPAVYCGLDSERGHATPEHARLAEIVRGTKVMLMAALHFLAPVEVA